MKQHPDSPKKPAGRRFLSLAALVLTAAIAALAVLTVGTLDSSHPEVEAAPAPSRPVEPAAPPVESPPRPPGETATPPFPGNLLPWDSWSRDAAELVDRDLADPAATFSPETGFHAYGTSTTHCKQGECSGYWVPHFASGWLQQAGTLQGDAMPDRPAWVAPNDRVIWAPAVARIGAGYLLYFAATSGQEDHVGTKCLGVAAAASPAGPFVPQPHPLRCGSGWWSIDPYAVSDGSDWYLLWREDGAANPTGKIVGAKLTRDGKAFASTERQTLLVGEHTWEDGYDDRTRAEGGSTDAPGASPDLSTTMSSQTAAGAGGAASARRLPQSHRSTQNTSGIGPIENPAMARHPETGEWLLTWSANRWETQAYATGLAVCEGPLGPCQRRSYDAPWVRTSADAGVSTVAEFGGAGGLSFLTGPDNRLYAVFHAYRGSGSYPNAPRLAWIYRVDASQTVEGYTLNQF